MNARNSKKTKKYNKIVRESLEGFHQGFGHREHRTRKDKSGDKKPINFKRDYIEEEREEEWKKIKQEIKQSINIIGR